MSIETIAADDESTWPDAVRTLLDTRLEDLRSYHERRREIDEDPMNRYLSDPPPNAWKEKHDETIASIDDEIAESHLIGWHCTRLTPDEIETIRRDGMRVTGADLAAERVKARVAAGEMTDTLATLLLSKSCAEHTGKPHEYGRRKGMIHFCFTRGCLRSESGVWRLLSTWGGEMLYWHHADHPEVGRALQALGTACIIETAIPVPELEAYGSVGDRLLRWYLHHHDVETEHGDDWQGHTKSSIPGSRVRRVVRRSDPDFGTLTECDRWHAPIT